MRSGHGRQSERCRQAEGGEEPGAEGRDLKDRAALDAQDVELECAELERNSEEVSITWFKEAGRMPRHDIQAEVTRLSAILDRDLCATFRSA